MHVDIFFNPHPRMFFLLILREREKERERERERERGINVRNTDWLPPLCALTRH